MSQKLGIKEILILTQTLLSQDTLNHLSINDTDCEALSIEILNKNSKNIIVSTVYRPPSGNLKSFKKHLKAHISHNNVKNKSIYIAGDFNVNLFQHSSNNNVKNFVNTLLQYNLLPTINQPTRVTRTTSTLIDNIITNNFLQSLTGVIVTDISDHFPNFILCSESTTENTTETVFYKRSFDNDSIKNFQNLLTPASWELVTDATGTNHAYEAFIAIFSRLYEKTFPKKQVSIKIKSLKNKWMTKGVTKSSKRKQRLYERFLKNKTYINEKAYKTYKNTFEKIKFLSKKLHYSNLLNDSFGNSKRTWDTMKEIIGKVKTNTNQLPKQLNYKSELLFNKVKIAESFNDFFVSVGSDLASKIPAPSRDFNSFLDECETPMPTASFSSDELRLAFRSLLPNKSPGLDEISVNIIKSVYHIIEPVLYHIFSLSIKEGVFPNALKVAKVTPIFKSGNNSEVGNYRPISVLPCFSKILERIMYNRL